MEGKEKGVKTKRGLIRNHVKKSSFLGVIRHCRISSSLEGNNKV